LDILGKKDYPAMDFYFSIKQQNSEEQNSEEKKFTGKLKISFAHDYLILRRSICRLHKSIKCDKIL